MSPINNKTIMVVVSKNVIRRNILETHFWSAFKERLEGSRIILVGEPGGEALYEKYRALNVEIVYLKKYPVTFLHKLVLFMVRTGTNTHGVKLYRWRSYELGETKLLITIIKSIIANSLGRLSVYHHFVRWLYGKLSVAYIEELYDTYEPDMVFTPSLIDLDYDSMIAVAAQRRGVKVVGMVRSWDNLAIHGLLPCIPDVFIFQNEYLKWCAEHIQSVSFAELKTSVIGVPHYDAYRFPERFLKSREDFFRENNLDIHKKLILFGGFDFYWSEDILVAQLDQAIEDGRLRRECQVVFRPHPKTPFQIDDYHLEKLNNTVLNTPFIDKTKAFNDQDYFINLLYHCDVLINVASTLAIDGSVFDKPVICVNFDDADRGLPRWKQVGRLFDSFDHYEALVATGCARVPTSFNEMITDINEYLVNPTLDHEGRMRAIEKFVAPFDGGAGERLVKDVLAVTESL